MSSIRNLLFFAFSLASIVLAQAAPQESQSVSSKASDKENFRELLNALPEESIHAALDSHARPKYKEGVFEFHKDALDKVHDDDPLLASKVVQWAAILELRKRQAPSNTSSTTTTSSDSSSSTPPSTSVTTTTVTSDSTTTETITSTTPSPSSSPTVTPSSTPSSTPTDSSSPPPSSTMETSRTRSLVVITTTLTNGHVKTITEYTYVAPTPAETDNAGPSATHNSPSLQSGAANVLSRRWGVEAAALVGGAVGVAWIL